MVDVVADLPADTQAAEPVQQRDRSSPDPAVHAQAGAMPGATPGAVRGDLEPADLVPVDLVVMAAVGVQALGAAQWPAALTADRWDGLDQRDRLDDVVAVAAGGDCRERDAARFDDRLPARRHDPERWLSCAHGANSPLALDVRPAARRPPGR
ncbi:hypothetical protein ACIBO5_23335 [Nonomuraea angiospora]|uniref:hypothetical protein n=1 Tax=Nonomuraea angiospora TaxID=46172 RepID=UPI0037AB3F67